MVSLRGRSRNQTKGEHTMTGIPNTFKDGEGRTWKPILTTPVVIDACRELQITISNLLELTINVGDMIDLLWYTCRGQAAERKLTQEDFYADIPLRLLPDAVGAVMGVLQESFPQMKDALQGLANAASPFGLGKSMTSSNSVVSQESAPKTT